MRTFASSSSSSSFDRLTKIFNIFFLFFFPFITARLTIVGDLAGGFHAEGYVPFSSSIPFYLIRSIRGWVNYLARYERSRQFLIKYFLLKSGNTNDSGITRLGRCRIYFAPGFGLNQPAVIKYCTIIVNRNCLKFMEYNIWLSCSTLI